MKPARAFRRLAVAAFAVALTAGVGGGWAGADTEQEFHWSRLDASIDVSTWAAGQVSGVVRVWGAHAFSHLDDSPAARAIGSPMDVGILATASGFKGVPYPLTSESLSPGGADKAQFADASKSIPGVVDAKQVFSAASTRANPPAAAAEGGGQSAVTPNFTVSNYRANSNLADDGNGKVAGHGTVSLDQIVMGPLAVGNVTSLIEGATDGTQAGTKMAARTLVTGATVNGIPVEIGSSGVTVADQRGGGEGVAALNEQISSALKSAGIFEVSVAEPKTSTGPNGLSTEAGGLRVKFVPTPEMSGVVNAAVPVEAAFAAARGNLLATARGEGGSDDGFGGGVLEPDPSSVIPPVAPGDGSAPSVFGDSGSSALPSASSTMPASGGTVGASGLSSVAGATSDGVGTGVSESSAATSPAAAPPGPTDLQAKPITAVRWSDAPWVAALALFSAAILAIMVVAARRGRAGLAPSSLRQAMESLTGGAS
jgi:hypothetical protein